MTEETNRRKVYRLSRNTSIDALQGVDVNIASTRRGSGTSRSSLAQHSAPCPWAPGMRLDATATSPAITVAASPS